MSASNDSRSERESTSCDDGSTFRQARRWKQKRIKQVREKIASQYVLSSFRIGRNLLLPGGLDSVA